MGAVARLETLVELDHADALTMSASARQEAVLEDGRRLVLLDDRGWSAALNRLGPEVPDIRAVSSIKDIEHTARSVVGPDEPFDGHSQEHMESSHWDHLSEILRRQGVVVPAPELRRLRHDVVIGEGLRDWLAGPAQ